MSDKVCFSPMRTMAWIFVIASALWFLGALVRSDYEGWWFIAMNFALAAFYLFTDWHERRKS